MSKADPPRLLGSYTAALVRVGQFVRGARCFS